MNEFHMQHSRTWHCTVTTPASHKWNTKRGGQFTTGIMVWTAAFIALALPTPFGNSSSIHHRQSNTPLHKIRFAPKTINNVTRTQATSCRVSGVHNNHPSFPGIMIINDLDRHAGPPFHSSCLPLSSSNSASIQSIPNPSPTAAQMIRLRRLPRQ